MLPFCFVLSPASLSLSLSLTLQHGRPDVWRAGGQRVPQVQQLVGVQATRQLGGRRRARLPQRRGAALDETVQLGAAARGGWNVGEQSRRERDVS